MKLAEEKFQYKSHFFKLGQGRIVPHDDVRFWNVLIDSPLDSSHVFDLLTANDIHGVRDQNLPNFLVFVRVLAGRIVKMREKAVLERQRLVNCVRLLTRLVPFLYELPNYSSDIELELFWEHDFHPDKFCSNSVALSLMLRRNLVPAPEVAGGAGAVLAVELVHSLVGLLFVPGFTTDEKGDHGLFWEPGIGHSGAYGNPDPRLDVNRTDILRLLLTLTSSLYYLSLKDVTAQGSRFLTTLVSTLPKNDLVHLLCSLVNIVCRSARVSNSDSGLALANTTLTELRYTCINYSFQLLVTTLVYPLPSSEHAEFLKTYGVLSKRPSNSIRLFFGKLSKESEVMFLATHFLNYLRFPIFSLKDEAKRRFFKFGQPSLWALESTVVLWELLQCNKTFSEQLGPRFVPKLVPYLVYHIFAFYDLPQYFSLVKIMSHFLLYISSQEERVQTLVSIEPAVDGFPSETKVNGVGSTRDFAVINICQVLSKLASHTNHHESKLHSFLRPTLIEVLYNLIPTVNDDVKATDISSKSMSNVNPKGGLSYKASNAVTQVILKYSDRTFLLEDPSNPSMLALLVRALCASATKNPAASRMTLFTFLKNEKAYDHVWNVIYGLKNESIEHDCLENVNEEEEDENASQDQTQDLSQSVNLTPQQTPNQHPAFNTPSTPISKQANNGVFSPFPNTQSTPVQEVRSPYTASSNATSVDDGFIESTNNSRTSIPEVDPLAELMEEEKALAAALRPNPPTGMSQKFRDKLPLEAPLSRSWGGNDALRIIITILIPNLKTALKEVWSKRDECNFDNFFIVKQIENSNFEEVIQQNRREINHDFLPETPIDKLSFSWNHRALGWYLSIINSNNFRAPDNIKLFIGTNNTLMKNISSSIALLGKIASSWSGLSWNSNQEDPKEEELTRFVEANLSTINPWAHTNVKLFKVDEENDKAYNPFGLKYNSSSNTSVSDLTNSLVKKLGDFRNGSRGSIVSISSIPQEDPERPKLNTRNSVSSLHSLNTLNRTRSNTPRNSISM